MSARRILPAAIIGLTLAAGILIGTLISRGVRAARASGGGADAGLLPPPSPVELSNSFARIAAEVEPAVVNINTESTIHLSRRRYRAPEDSPFGDFFDRFFQFGPPDNSPGDIRQHSLGSGIILDKNGFILTNYHVIAQDGEERPVDRIRVQLHDDDNPKGYEAKIVGTDRWTDLAVIKMNLEKPVPTVQLGDSDAMRVGDWVLAIGSPFGFESTVTAGIVSAKGRDVEGGTGGQFKRFIQTDAAINPGNSGGPLVNLAGQVIGINTAIATRRGTYDGVDFAIPSNTARKVYNSIISTGGVQRGAIGVTFRNENNAALLRSFGTDHGVVVNGVEKNSPADRAGLKRGDVILSVNGTPINRGDQLVDIVSDTEVGKKLKVEFLRDTKRLSTEVQVGDRNKIIAALPANPAIGNENQGREEAGGALGVSIRNLTREQAHEVMSELNLASPQGVLVADVKSGGFAADLGVSRGDLILSINHQSVASVDDFDRIQSRLKSGNDVLLLIAQRRRGTFTTLFLADRLP